MLNTRSRRVQNALIRRPPRYCPPGRQRSCGSRRRTPRTPGRGKTAPRSEEHTSELQSPCNLVCRLLLEKKNAHVDSHVLVQDQLAAALLGADVQQCGAATMSAPTAFEPVTRIGVTVRFSRSLNLACA